MKCIMCDGVLDIEEMCESSWLPDPWCTLCISEEEQRSLEWDTIPDSLVRWREPRYMIKCTDWYDILHHKLGYSPPEELEGNNL